MIKRKILMVTLPLIGVATIVGSGFSAWYFNTTGVAPITNKIGVTVTEKHITAGVLSSDLPSTAKLVLDQGGSKTEDATALNKLIYVTDGSDEINSVKFVFTIPTATANELKASAVKAVFKVETTVDSRLSKYITATFPTLTTDIKFNETTGTIGTAGLVYSTDSTNNIYTYTVSLADSTTVGSPFVYKANNPTSTTEPGKPFTETQYDGMAAEINGITDGIVFNSSVEFEPY